MEDEWQWKLNLIITVLIVVIILMLSMLALIDTYKHDNRCKELYGNTAKGNWQGNFRICQYIRNGELITK